MMTICTDPIVALDEVDAARALLYRLLSRALVQAPDATLLSRMARLAGDGSDVGVALRDLAAAAAATPIEAVRREYDTLFIGVARGELLPYASFYLTGFLHERPLARLRVELGGLGLEPADGRSDPEDHMATVCEIMAVLIERGDPAREAGFFDRHVAPWAAAFFTDLQRAASARFYRPVGALGGLLVDLDRQGFAYSVEPSFTKGAA